MAGWRNSDGGGDKFLEMYAGYGVKQRFTRVPTYLKCEKMFILDECGYLV